MGAIRQYDTTYYLINERLEIDETELIGSWLILILFHVAQVPIDYLYDVNLNTPCLPQKRGVGIRQTDTARNQGWSAK